MSYSNRYYSDRGYTNNNNSYNDHYNDRYLDTYRPQQQNRNYNDNYNNHHNDRYVDRYPQQQNRTYSNQPQRITLGREYIQQIKSGDKTIEGRVNTTMFQKLQVGNNVVFYENRNESNEVECRIVAKRKYDSFRDMLSEEGVAKCLPRIKSLEEAVGIYNKIPGYTEKARQFGVLAIEIETLTKPIKKSNERELPKVVAREKEKEKPAPKEVEKKLLTIELKRSRSPETEKEQIEEHKTKKTCYSNEKR